LLVADRLRQTLVSPSASGTATGSSPSLFGASLPEALPVVLHRRLQTGLIINAASNHVDQAIDLAQAMLWQLLCGVAPGRAKLTLIDPVGRGQNFASFMSMTDHQPDLVGHRVWSGERHIEERIAELAHHAEDILQVNLRDRFDRIEQYNAIAGSMFEPYRAIAAIGFPENLTRDAYKHLRAIIESSTRCGVFMILVCDQSRPWPSDMPMPTDRRMLQLTIDADGHWQHGDPELNDIPFQPISSPPATMRPGLVQRIGNAAVQASKVEIPFDSIAASTVAISDGQTKSTPQLPSTAQSDDQLVIPIGVQGARRLQSLKLGEGVKQHVLIAGKTGSGKSSLLHTIITAGAARYRPDQLQFYLLDFKKGVEFKIYAEARLPHARVVGIESEREFGRSVLQRLDADLQARGELFRDAGVQELSEYRARTGKAMPRVLLVIDEFQEIFSRDDRLAADCTVLLDRLVRQGRSFGMHVILSSQSLAGAQSLPRATLGQMAVRIALQCSESDAVLILSDDNTAARLISRPGEAIYNDAGGLLEGNQPFQVAYLTAERQKSWLESITARDEDAAQSLPPPVVFEGNRPCRWSSELVRASMTNRKPGTLTALLGEAVEIGPPAALVLSRESGRNVLVVAPTEMTGGLIASCLSGFAAPLPCGGHASLLYFDGGRSDDLLLGTWLSQSGVSCEVIKPRDSESRLAQLADLIQQRADADDHEQPPVVLVIDPLERFRDLRQDEAFSFSLDAAAAPNGAESLQKILRDGPAVGVFSILVCSSAETLSRWLPRGSRHDLQQRILGRINPADSSALIDSPDATNLSAATMLIYDDADGSLKKFRVCDLPDPETVRQWLASSTEVMLGEA
ncbi:MAG: FtsK/SpoIIIE domain-containing protein, partial [Planctomycetaceae bacterium]